MVQILDQFGNPIPREVLREQQTAQLGWVAREFAEHPSRGLTPQRLARILEAAEQGDLTAQADLGSDMEEKDAHISAELSKRKRALLTLDWRIEPPRDASAAEKKQAAQLQEWLTDLPDFEDVLLDALDAIGHGFAALEITWQTLGAIRLPAAITHQAQRKFMTLPHDGNALRLRDGSVEGAELWPFGWVVHRHRAKSGYLTRAGLHRVLAWPFLFKNYSVRDLAEFLEIYGLPLRVGKYPTGASDDEKATLLQALAGIGHNAAGIIPEGMLIEFQAAAQGTHDPFQAMIDWCERAQSKAILGGTLTSQADGKSSTHALGNVHNEVRQDLKVADARQLGGTLSRDLLFPLSAFNFSDFDPRRVCRFVFDTREPEDLQLYANSLPSLVGMGMRIPQSWAHGKLAIPEAQGDEPVLALPASTKPDLPVPVPAPVSGVAAATRHYRAVLTNAQGEVIGADQAALDAAADAVFGDEIDHSMLAVMKGVIGALQTGTDPDTAAEALVASYPQLDDSALRELLTRAIFVADVWGRLNAD